MRLNELRKLVHETVRGEQRKARKAKTERKFNTLVESTVLKILKEEDEEEEAQEESGGSDKMSDIVKDGMKGLSQIGKTQSPEDANQMQEPNPKDAVPVSSEQKGFSAQSLMPSQKSMNLGKAVHFALGMLNSTMYNDGNNGTPGGDTGAFICKNYLLDGHHRWVATCLVAPGANVNGYEMTGITPEQAVGVLNAATGVLMGHNKGKDGKGSFADFKKDDKILAILKEKDQDKVEKDEKTGEEKINYGVPNTPGPGKATEICEKWAAGEYNHEGMTIQKFDGDGDPPKGEEALKWAAKAMATNAGKCPGVNDSAVLTSLGRIEMPVADDLKHAKKVDGNPIVKDTAGVIDALTKGKIDVTTESINLDRWSKLAGILKD